MTKQNQPFTLTLKVPNDLSDLSSAQSASIEYQKPSGSTGTWTTADGVALNKTAETVTYEVPANACDEAGDWRFIAVVTFTDGKVIPGSAFKHPIAKRFA